MNCEYKYRYILTKKDRIKIHLMILNEVPMKIITERYGLTKQFLRCKHQDLIENTTAISFNGKVDPYHEDEMEYGKKDLEYKWDSLSESEIKFYENNRK